jgi:hypothetical protein
MKIDRIVQAMTESDVQIVMSTAIRDHLHCECVDRRDPEVFADHLADIVVEVLEPTDDDLADYVLKEGKYAQ